MPQVTLEPGGATFECAAEESILSAALRAGYLIPYGCKNGACGSCKGTLKSGELRYGAYQTSTLPEAERVQGKALFCVAHPVGDVVIEARDVRKTGDIVVKTMPCRIEHLDRVTDDVMIVRFKLPSSERLLYRAGQYMEFILKDGARRSFSMANAPHDDALIELHIRHMSGGLFTDRLFGVRDPAVKVREIFRFEGPHGSFFLREESEKPIIFLASGTGFAPIKAIVEHMIYTGNRRKAVIYWGGRRPSDLYLDHLVRSWVAKYPDQFSYVPVVSNALAEDDWQGRTGFVHRAVMEDLPDLSAHQVYACGAPVVIDSARRDFVAERRLPESDFFADSFTSPGR
ncbi:MAG: CDP-6-deoxy-delta-3,4-glucoseen reductase [Burkholderiales bacterium]|nr:MAG: CDP-6-deoxy-delta-3,4-glucoseen reductase [Burkholderiales bacterium]TAG80878.1 MAG: CDP-6-deoxy-delta-3,4-glucoseen reductase [Betaproteobacteria bacterium]